MSRGQSPGHVLAGRLTAWFEGEPDEFADVNLVLPPGFYGVCARVLRKVPRGEVVTYGELAALAGRPRAARAAGTFCARCDLAPFLPVHRVVSASGVGSWGDLGVDYKRRLLELEGVLFP
jgi:methylated-DNA-[protein]-cysteine S-methyltransferase